MTDYHQKLESRFRQYPLSAPPPPWKQTWSGSISGLLEIGFASVSELLLGFLKKDAVSSIAVPGSVLPEITISTWNDGQIRFA